MTESLTLLRPIWLLLLVPLAAFVFAVLSRKAGTGGWEQVARPGLLRAMEALGQVDQAPTRGPLIGVTAAAALLVLALSGPAIERRDAPSFRNLDAVVFVLDISPSVTESPAWPDTLAIGRFGIASLGTRPGALVIYGGDAYVAVDLTADHRQLGQTLSLIDSNTMPYPGSRPERGLALAHQILTQGRILTGDVILITDGGGIGFETGAPGQMIADAGARLSVIALDGVTPQLTALTEDSGGRMFERGDQVELSRFLTRDDRTVLERQAYPLLYWRDLGRWLILAAALLLLLQFRRRGA